MVAGATNPSGGRLGPLILGGSLILAATVSVASLADAQRSNATSMAVQGSQPTLHLQSINSPYAARLVGRNWRGSDRLKVSDQIYGSHSAHVLHVVTSTLGRFHVRVPYYACGGVRITVSDRFGNRAAISRGPHSCY